VLKLLLEQGWGKGWASFFTSPAPFEEVRHHFRKFLMVQIEGGQEVYFRFYDPRVMRDFLPAASPSEIATFFGPVSAFLLEAQQPEIVLNLAQAPVGLRTTHVNLPSR
jgi:hypothetical protein